MTQRTSILALAAGEMLRRKERTAFTNSEGLADYDFVLRAKTWRHGVSAMLRVKNEARKILSCLSSLIGAVDEVVVIDNASTDATVDLVRTFKHERDARNKVSLLSYPFTIARCGAEHRNTPADSVRSLVYYYNWCLSKCRCSYVFKIDADMVLLPEGVQKISALFNQLSPLVPTVVAPAVQTMYRAPDGRWFLANDEINCEPRIFPNTSAIRYHKGRHWEELRCGIPARRMNWNEVLIYELKDTSEDEFAHWTDTDFPTARKQKEWRNFNLVKSGDISRELFTEIASVPVRDKPAREFSHATAPALHDPPAHRQPAPRS
jgi:glycosyltransferase involved in cell wall biosynthesis